MLTNLAGRFIRILITGLFALVVLAACGGSSTEPTIESPEEDDISAEDAPAEDTVREDGPAPLEPACTLPEPPSNDPYVAICAESVSVQAGEQVRISTRSFSIHQVQFLLLISSPGVEGSEQQIRVEMSGSHSEEAGAAALFRTVSVTREGALVTFVLEAVGAGEVEVRVTANGEIRISDPSGGNDGAFTFKTIGSETLTASITE